MTKSVSKLWLWFQKATVDERKQLASLVKSSVASIRFAAKAFRHGGSTNISADFAARLEKGIAIVNDDSSSDLPAIRREDLCDACRECPYQLKCNMPVQKGEYD